jgi:hypothetical protein
VVGLLLAVDFVFLVFLLFLEDLEFLVLVPPPIVGSNAGRVGRGLYFDDGDFLIPRIKTIDPIIPKIIPIGTVIRQLISTK